MTQQVGAAIHVMPTVLAGGHKQTLAKAWNDISNSDKTILQRLLEISHKHKLSHLGSCLSAAPIIHKIYQIKQPDDVFILSCGHSGLALYCVLEAQYGYDAEALFEQHGVHPNRDIDHGIYLSTGSLGQGITVACGVALASPNRHVYCLVSDGECAEGSVWESLRFIQERPLYNITIIVNANGYSAFDRVDLDYLEKRLTSFLPKIVLVRTPSTFAGIPPGLEAHYHVMSPNDYDVALGALS